MKLFEVDLATGCIGDLVIVSVFASYSPSVRVQFHASMLTVCEITEVAHVEDAIGYPCGRGASGRCCDCGAHLCDAHSESCTVCTDLFCETCYSFHARAYHQKKTSTPEREYRKSA